MAQHSTRYFKKNCTTSITRAYTADNDGYYDAPDKRNIQGVFSKDFWLKANSRQQITLSSPRNIKSMRHN